MLMICNKSAIPTPKLEHSSSRPWSRPRRPDRTGGLPTRRADAVGPLLLLNARDLAALERASDARSAADDGADFIILATRVQLCVGKAERGERGQGGQGLRVSRVLTLELLTKRKGP